MEVTRTFYIFNSKLTKLWNLDYVTKYVQGVSVKMRIHIKKPGGRSLHQYTVYIFTFQLVHPAHNISKKNLKCHWYQKFSYKFQFENIFFEIFQILLNNDLVTLISSKATGREAISWIKGQNMACQTSGQFSVPTMWAYE